MTTENKEMKKELSFNELLEQLKEKKVSRANKGDLMDLFVAFGKEENYIMQEGSSEEKLGEPIALTENFSKMLESILVKAGMDKSEAEKVVSEKKGKLMNKKSWETMYNIFREVIGQYLETGGKVQLINKQHMNATLYAGMTKEKIYKRENVPSPINKGELTSYEVKHDPYLKVGCVSKAPKNARHKIM